jgi:protocatechuate 3,4-dioxygenase beta subunit
MKTKLSGKGGRSSLAARAAVAALLVACSGASASAAAQGSATLSGKITDGERGLPGVTVSLISNAPQQPSFRAAARTRTDAEGRYRFDGVGPGRYQVYPHAPAHVGAERGDNWPPGSKLVNVLAGDEIEDVDFRLTPGGVVTGRVTDADGRPVVGEPVSVARVDTPGGERPPAPLNFRPQMTDDRGVYRVYGLPPGNYRVSVGQVGGPGGLTFGLRRHYRRTFHPDTTEESEARLVEVTEGGEAENVDISVGRPAKTYAARGRVVYAENGQPAPGASVSYGAVDASGRRISALFRAAPADARGEFRFENLAPGRYAAMIAQAESGSEAFGEPVPFEVTSGDVSGIEIRLRRSATVSGVVRVEGVTDRAALARLYGQVRIFGFVETPPGGLTAPMSFLPAAVGADGSFSLSGVRPGKLRINVDARGEGLSVARVELGGAPATDGIQVAEGAQVSGVRVILVRGAATVRGQVTTTNLSLPPDARLFAFARRQGGDSPLTRNAQVDARGRFQFERLPAGTYEFRAQAVTRDGRRFESQPQQIFVAEGSEQQIAIALDPAALPPPRVAPPGGP